MNAVIRDNGGRAVTTLIMGVRDRLQAAAPTRSSARGHLLSPEGDKVL